MSRFFLYPDYMDRTNQAAHHPGANQADATHGATKQVDAAPADALAALRAATDSRHQQLDSGLPIGAPGATLDDYASHLRMLQAWLAPLQAWLSGFDDGPRPDHGGRLALIAADLAEPGMPGAGHFPNASDAPVPAALADWPAQASPAWRWGVNYVIEGSQLGGAVLYARLAERLAPHPLRYLKGDATGPGPRWRAFMQGVRAHVRTPAEIADACAGACAAFDSILAAGQHLGHQRI